MNVAAVKKKLEEYYSKVTPGQVVREFEALGVEFVNTPEVKQIEFNFGPDFIFEFNTASQAWLDDFLVNSSKPVSAVHSPNVFIIAAAPTGPTQKEPIPTAGNTQFAMAA